MKNRIKELRDFYVIWSTQSLSQLGSGKGAGAALMMFILGVTGIVLCVTSGQIMKRYN